MKKILLALLSILSLTANAQISLDANDLPNVGDQVIFIVDSSDAARNVNLGTAAGNQNWDFTGLGVSFYDTLRYLNPATTPAAANFPNANLALESFGTTYYFIKSAQEYLLDGISGDLLGLGEIVSFNLNPNQSIFEFPTNYLDTYNQTILVDTVVDTNATLFDSIRIKNVVITETIFDAWGDVNTLAGSFASLRSKTTSITYDSIFVHNPFIGWSLFNDGYDSSITYQWYAKNEKYAIAEVSIDIDGNISTVSYQPGNNVSAVVSSNSGVSCHNDCDAEVTITPISGTAPYSYSWPSGTPNDNTAIDLCPGNYTTTITDANNSSFAVQFEVIEPDNILLLGSISNESAAGNDAGITLNASGGAGGFTYLWSNGATSRNLTAIAGGDYTVTVTDANGCVESQTFTVGSSVGIDDLGISVNLSIYPNPVNFQFQVKSNTQIDNLRIINLLGEEVLVIQNIQVKTVDITSLQNGVYFAIFTTAGGEKITKKLVKGN